MNKRSREEQIALANKVKAFLEDGLFDEVIDGLKEDISTRFFSTDSCEETVREGLWRQAQSLQDVRDLLKGYVQRGVQAEKAQEAPHERI